MTENCCLPALFYDTEIDIDCLYENRPYRNIGHLLSSCKSVKDALRLCGAEERIIDGTASDYEFFLAICLSMSYLAGHDVFLGIDTLFKKAFNISEMPSPFNAEALWSEINGIIEEQRLSPFSLLERLNVESISVRLSPFDTVKRASDTVDLYYVTELSDIIKEITSKKNTASSLENFISLIKDRITVLDNEGSPTVRIRLRGSYRFERYNKKHELYEIYNSLINGKSVTESNENGIITYVISSISDTVKRLGSNLIIDCECQSDELCRLFEYLDKGSLLPESAIIRCDDGKRALKTALSFCHRNPYGLPSILPVCSNILECARLYPIGLLFEYQNGITDVIALSSVLSRRQGLYDSLACLCSTDTDSLFEDLTYTNIKNRMRI